MMPACPIARQLANDKGKCTRAWCGHSGHSRNVLARYARACPPYARSHNSGLTRGNGVQSGHAGNRAQFPHLRLMASPAGMRAWPPQLCPEGLEVAS